MPRMTPRGTITGMVWLAMLLAATVPGDARAQSGGPETFAVETDAELRALLAQAEDRLAAGNAGGAYGLLAPNEAAYAGNPLYDYLLGVAALDTQRVSEAIFSLERALTVAPAFSGARLELARAYFESGQRERARPLFEQTLDEQPPPALRDVITRYLLAIDAAPPVPRDRFVPYVELLAGHDSNANGSTADEQFMGFTLNSRNVATDSAFAEVGAGFDWYLPRSNRFAWLLGARAVSRRNPDAGFVDSTIASGGAGFNWRRSAWFGGARLHGYAGARDGSSNESFVGADVSLGRRLNDHWDLGAALQGGAQRFDDSIEILDVDRLLYSLNLTRRFDNGSRVTLSALGGEDSETRDGSPYGNSKAGARLLLHLPLGASARFFASVGSLTSDYDGLFFGVPREDRQLTGSLELEFRDVLVDGLSVSPRVRLTDNDSDIALYQYDRTEIGVGLKWTQP